MKCKQTFFTLSLLQRIKWRAEVAWWNLSGVQKPVFDIIITTYIARFDTYLKGILFQLSRLFPGYRIVVVVNGYYDQGKQAAYLDHLRRYASRFSGVHLVICEEPTGLSTMWNRAIGATHSERLLILNDDLYLMSCFRRELQKAYLVDSRITLINDSWSHFLITRHLFQQIGPFDDRFDQVGYEDRDYEVRLACAGIRLDNVSVAGIVNCVEHPLNYSYGERIDITDNKYSSLNRKYFFRKWTISDKESSGSVYVPRFSKWVTIPADRDRVSNSSSQLDRAD